MKLMIRPEAEDDIEEAFQWYEQQSEGLGADFLLCLEDGFARVRRAPEAYPMVHKGVRRLLVRRFPYGIFYLAEPRSIVVLAVLHCGRDPKAWKSRS